MQAVHSPANNESEWQDRAARAHYEAVNMRVHGHVRPTWDELPEQNRQWYCADQAAAIAAIRKAGWAVVPVEPTEEMIRATDSRNESFLWTDDEITNWEWAAMLAAAPGVKL
jgi:hypothetical protein